MSHEGIRIQTREEQERDGAENRPLDRNAVTPAKVRVLLTEGKGLEIDWMDGHKSAWSFAWLRDACPCATCVEQRKLEDRRPGQPKPKPAQLLPMYAPLPKPLSAHGVGRYAIEFAWNDGHRSGIYSWDYLRRNCQCGECTFEKTETRGTPN
jgi:DUF971 family protein